MFKSSRTVIFKELFKSNLWKNIFTRDWRQGNIGDNSKKMIHWKNNCLNFEDLLRRDLMCNSKQVYCQMEIKWGLFSLCNKKEKLQKYPLVKIS